MFKINFLKIKIKYKMLAYTGRYSASKHNLRNLKMNSTNFEKINLMFEINFLKFKRKHQMLIYIGRYNVNKQNVPNFKINSTNFEKII